MRLYLIVIGGLIEVSNSEEKTNDIEKIKMIDNIVIFNHKLQFSWS